MSVIEFGSGDVSPKEQQDINEFANGIPFEQNNLLRLNQDKQGQKNQNLSIFSQSASSLSKMQPSQKIRSLRALSKFLMIFKKKSQGLNENQRQFTHFQKIYQEKLFHPELASKQLAKSKFLFDSNNVSYLVWQQLKLVYILFLLLFVTFHWSFDDLNEVIDSKQVCVIYFLLIFDIVAQFNVSIIIKGQIINDRYTIFKQYLTGTFIENVAFLFSLVFLVKTNHQVAAIVFYITGIKIFYQIIDRLQDILDFDFIRSEIVKLIKLVVFINLLAHFIACLWHYVGLKSEDEQPNWLDAQGIRNAQKQIRYLYSFYWSVTTMVTVGYGDITPMNPSEMIVCLFVMLISCGVFAFSLNLIGQVLETYNQYQNKLNINFRTLNNYFKQHNISEELQNRSKNYLEYAIKEEEQERLSDVFCKLPSTLRQEIIEEAFVKMLPQIPILHNNFSQATLKKASSHLQMICYQPGDYIINQNSQVKDDPGLYLIEQGQVQVFEQQSKTVLFNISSGQAFGEFQFFTEYHPKYSFICKSEARIFKLSRSAFLNLLTKDDFESFRQIKNCYQFNIPIPNLNCKFCDSSKHFTETCKLFFFGRDFSNLFLDQENQKQLRAPFERKNFRYQSLLHQSNTLEVQFQYLENYLQEHQIEQTEDIVNLTKTVESNFNSALNIFKHSDKKIPSDQENNLLRQCISQHMKATLKSEPKLKAIFNDVPQVIQERYVVFEVDKMKSFNKYFSNENCDNQIQKYNRLCKNRCSPQEVKKKLQKAMRFIEAF